jgi:amino acid transporter
MESTEVDQLPRRLKLRQSAAITFSTVGAAAGLFGLFGFSYGAAGGAFFWSWPLVGIGVFAICLVWAELSSHMPLAGSFYHWAVAVGGRKAGWWVGWMYLAAQIIVLTGWYFLVPVTLAPLIGVEFTPGQTVIVAALVIVVAAIVNAAGIELLGRIVFVGVIAELTIGFVLTTWLFVASDHQPLSTLFDLGGSSSFTSWLPAFLGAGIFAALWVLFTFESAGAVGEETHDAHRSAPRAVLLAYAGTMVLGFFFLISVLLAIPDPAAIAASPTPVTDIIDAWLPAGVSKAYLVLLLGIELLGCNAMFTAVSRLLFGMARAGQIPLSSLLSKTRNGTPYMAILGLGFLALLPLAVADQIAVIATGATAAIYFSYVLLLFLVLRARFKGWPAQDAIFSLGRWATPVSTFAFLSAAGALTVLLWPADSTNPVVGGVRASYWLVGLPLIVGSIYYFIARPDRRDVAEERALLSQSEHEGAEEARLRERHPEAKNAVLPNASTDSD